MGGLSLSGLKPKGPPKKGKLPLELMHAPVAKAPIESYDDEFDFE